MPRDPFYVTRAAEIAANIAMATLQDLGPGLWASIDSNCQGEAVATTLSGVQYVFAWDVTHQNLKLVQRNDPRQAVQIMEVVLAA